MQLAAAWQPAAAEARTGISNAHWQHARLNEHSTAGI
jgi:hypothetical protein